MQFSGLKTMNTRIAEEHNLTRFDFIDLLKGFGILLVVWGHTMTPRSFYIYSFHMPLFFFLSGYVHKEKPFRSFVFSKINTLYVPYIAFSLFSWLFYLIRHILSHRSEVVSSHLPKLQSVVTGTADNGGNNPIWFLTCILVVSLIFFFLNRFVKNPILKWSFLFGLSLIGYHWGLTKFELLFQFEIALTGLVFYSLGHAVKEHNLVKHIESLKPLSLICFVAFCEGLHILTAYYNVNISTIRWVNMAGNVIGNYILFYISAFAGIIVFLVIGYKLWYVKVLNFLGLHTLTILGFHKPILQILNSIFNPYINTNSWHYGIFASIGAIALSLLIGRQLNRCLPFVIGKKPLFKPINPNVQIGI